VLFAGLLGVHGNKGPAEIPAKRAYIFRDVMRQAASLGVPVAGPPTHPFNPLRALRMCIALEENETRRRFGLALMDGAWRHGRDLSVPAELVRLADECGLEGASLVQRADDPVVKQRLATQTSDAAAAGVFGVPTFVCEGELFWGADRIEAVLRRAAGHGIDETQLAAKLARPASAERKV
jgi:2-hydroxychromene-2-carboxylate isomerase